MDIFDLKTLRNEKEMNDIAKQLPLPQRRKSKPKIVCDFEVGESWGGGTVDTTNFITGTQARALTAPTNGTANMDLAFTTPVDFYNKNISVNVLSIDGTNFGGVDIYIALDSTFTKYAVCAVSPMFSGGWDNKTITMLDWTFWNDGVQMEANLPLLKNVYKIRFKLYAKASGSTTLTVDKVYSYDAMAQTGGIVFTFDDAIDNIYSNAKPILDKYAFPATIYAITGVVGTAGYMTLAQLKTLRDNGWIIASHTVNHVHLPQLDASTLTTELTNSKKWLTDNGFTPGDRYIAYPFGEFNQAVKNATRLLYTTGLSTVGRYFPSVATEQYSMPRMEMAVGASKLNTVAKMQSAIDAVKATNAIVIVYCHNILASGGDWTPTEFQQIVDYVATSGINVLTMHDLAQMYEY